MDAPDPPARLVLWGHFHSESGPTVVRHADGSWTVGMQQGTAGGVRQPTFTSFSTPFSPPLISADVYFYFRDTATGLITGVQPVHFRPDASVVIDDRIAHRGPGQPAGRHPDQARRRLADPTRIAETPRADPSPTRSPLIRADASSACFARLGARIRATWASRNRALRWREPLRSRVQPGSQRARWPP